MNIRTLKDGLSRFLRDVQRGDVILVTDRGRVVAEIRRASARGTEEERLQHLAAAGTLRMGLPNSPDAYRRSGVSLPARVVDEALDWVRGDR